MGTHNDEVLVAELVALHVGPELGKLLLDLFAFLDGQVELETHLGPLDRHDVLQRLDHFQ